MSKQTVVYGAENLCHAVVMVKNHFDILTTCGQMFWGCLIDPEEGGVVTCLECLAAPMLFPAVETKSFVEVVLARDVFSKGALRVLLEVTDA